VILEIQVFILRRTVGILYGVVVVGFGGPVLAWALFDDRVFGNRLTGVAILVGGFLLLLWVGGWAEKSEEARRIARRRNARRRRR
jgi:hypothetical protein